MWSKMFDACVRCGRTAYKHVSKGLCNSCYLSDYRQSHAAELKDMKHRWYLKNVTPLAAKLKREQFHFSGMREAALQRDNYKCCDCGTTEKLVVHHTDCNGRGSKSPNNALRNLKTLCRACHINAHRVELQVAAQRGNDGRSLAGKEEAWRPPIHGALCLYTHCARGRVGPE